MRKQKDDMQVNVAGLRRNIKNLAHNYSDAQVKVREATSNDPWGPSATIMAEVADLTYNVVAFSEIMQMIWKRLNDHGKNWRHVYKALILLEYLIKTGTEKVAQQCKENIFAIQTLREFVYFEEGKDQGTHVREKAKQLVNLLKDDERLKNERIKALKAKERFAQHPSGFGSDGYIDGPSQRDMPPGWQEEPKPVSELEMVRPQTAGEEELQLQLAMAMSREEAEQEEAKRRSDDVRLQLALSQSEQDFKETKKEDEPQSHLLDLLDISLGATGISSPPLGAVGGVGPETWGTPARAASQLSDPWSGNSSPQIDPWQPAALRSNTASAPLGAMAGMPGSSNGDPWGGRTQSPSVASGSSTEGWLQSNGGAMNGNITTAVVSADPWLSKSAVAPLAAIAPPAATNNSLDPWLSDSSRAAAVGPIAPPQKTLSLDDPWAPKAGSDDPWKNIEPVAVKKPSPDMDEFDIITNRNKTGDLLSNNDLIGTNNNDTSLLDEMDPLSMINLSNAAAANTTNNTKKPLKTPQAFLGENSSLVNLDNLIKPVVPQTQIGNAAYNPFSDTVIPPKTNLFQQQQPAVPSINQLKQQQPFTMTVNQDPWAPVNNTNVTSQQTLINYDSDESPVAFYAPATNFIQTNGRHLATATSTNYNYNNTMPTYSRSDYDIFNATTHIQSETHNYNNNSNTHNQFSSQSVDNIRNLQITAEVYEPANRSQQLSSDNTLYSLYDNPLRTSAVAASASSVTLCPYQYSNAAHTNATKQAFTPSYAYAADANRNQVLSSNNNNNSNNYSSLLSASLAATPGIKIAPLSAAATAASAGGGGIDIDGECDAGGSLFSYGFYDANTNTASLANCKMENNSNMPWIQPESAATSNPFLS